jgi:hypothetical protein
MKRKAYKPINNSIKNILINTDLWGKKGIKDLWQPIAFGCHGLC